MKKIILGLVFVMFSFVYCPVTFSQAVVVDVAVVVGHAIAAVIMKIAGPRKITEKEEMNFESLPGYVTLNNTEKALLFKNRGDKFYLKKKYEESLKDYNEAQTLDNKVQEVYLMKGFIYFRDKKYQEALDSFNHEIELNPLSEKAYFNRSRVKSKMRDNAGSKKDLAEYNRIKLSLIKADKKPDDASDLKTKYDEAYELYRKKKYAEALKELNSVLELNSKHVWSYYYRGLCYYRMKNYPSALSDFNSAIDLKDNESLFYRARADVKTRICDLDGAKNDKLLARKYKV